LVRSANAVDFWRGFALVMIFINHIPGIYFERFTYRNVSISDSAELFVFLAGWALWLSTRRMNGSQTAAQLVTRLGRRALTIYAAQILISSIAIAMLAFAARFNDNPLLLEWHNAAAVFYDPVNTHIGLVLLTHHLGYFDILPLYVVLVAAAPLVVLLHRWAPNWLPAAAFGLYLTTLLFRLSIPTWPTEGGWLFNPLAWQIVFILGFLMAQDQGVGRLVRDNILALRIVSLPAVLLGAVMALTNWWPDPTRVPEPKLLFIISKSYVTPIRLLQFLALVACLSSAFPHITRLAPSIVRFLSLLGRNSLSVFCVASVLSLGGQIVRFMYDGGITLDAAILVVGVAALGLTAWAAEWPSRLDKAKSFEG
jgi:hypothetical protein